MKSRRSWVVLLSVLSSIALSWSALAGVGSAAPALKKNYSSSIVPPTAVANTSTVFTFTIKNAANSQQTLGSANITVPSTYSSVSSANVTASAGKTWVTSSTGNLVKLRSGSSSGLAAGESVTVDITAIPSCPDSGTAWTTAVKQSNDFSGTGNDFTNPTGDPSVSVTGCADHLAFFQQPSNGTAGQSIAPAVTVEVQDSNNQRATSSSASISIAIGTNPSSGTLYGTATHNAASGLATFSNLAIDKAGTGYTLVASSTGLGSVTSHTFNITGTAVNCASSNPCNTPPAGNPNRQDNTTGSLSVPTTPSTCTLASCPFLSIDESTGSFCNNSLCIGNTIFFNWPSNTDGLVTAVGIWDKSVSGMKGASQFNVYKEGSNTPIPNCSNPTPAPGEAPCVLSKSRTGVGDLIITVLFDPLHDARWGTN